MKVVNLRPSPNEEARLLKEERDRKRKLRIKQVREQSKVNAAKLRESVQQEKERLLQELAVQLQDEWLCEKQAQLRQLEDTFEKSVSCVGEGHRQAVGEQIELQRDCRKLLQHEDLLRAQHRHEQAIQRQNEEMKQRQIEESKHIIARQAALEAEKARAMRIAALPPPPEDPVLSIEPVKLRPVRYTDQGAFSASHYHISNAVVERASAEEECDARLVAEIEEEKLRDAELEKKRVEHERTEKAYLRHKHALEKELLKEEYNKLLSELSELQRADVNRRRQALEQLPKQIFVAPHRRIEEREEQQHKMEKAFEDLYMTATEFTGDLRLTLDAQPVSASPPLSDSLDITAELAEVTPAAVPPSDQHPSSAAIGPPVSAGTSSDQSQAKLQLDLPKSSAAGEGPLKKLYERIRSQRENWQQRSLHHVSRELDAVADGSRSESAVHQETEDFPVHRNGIVQPGMASQLQGTLADLTPSIYRSDTALKTIEALSEGTITDSTPGSAVNYHTPSLEEGTILSSVSSYRSIAERPPGFNMQTRMSDIAAQSEQFFGLPCNLSSAMQDNGERRNTLAAHENALFNSVLHKQQQIEQERQELEDRLNVIESKQRQLEAQDRLISEALIFTPRSVAEPVTDGLRDADKAHVSDDLASHISGTRLGYYEHPSTSKHRGSTQLSSSVTDVSSSKPASFLPSSSYNRESAKEVVHSTVYSKPSVDSSLPVLPDNANISGDNEVGNHGARVREYQDELLKRQTDRQHALLEARRRLQMRAEQLLDSGLNLLSESPSNKHRAASHSQSFIEPSEKSHVCEMDSYGISPLSEDDASRVRSSDVLQTQVSVSKPYKPELYQPKSLSDDVEAFEYNAAAASTGDDDAGDERQFVTPELKEDGRVRPCRVAEYSPSPSPHADDAAYTSLQLSMSTGQSVIKSNKDDFNSLILQAQRDLEVRQQQMQDQLEALENEERRLTEQQLRISSQLGSFPSKIQTFTHTAHSQPQTAVLDPYISSSSDLLTDGVSPSLSARNTLSISHDNTYPWLSEGKDSLDMSGLRSSKKVIMAVDNASPQTESHQIHSSHSAPVLHSRNGSYIHVTSDQLPPSTQSPQSVDRISRSHSVHSTAVKWSENIEGSFRALSPLNATSDNSTQYGDHSRQVETSPAPHISPHLQQSFGDRGDASHMFEDALHEVKSSKSVSGSTFVGHMSQIGVPTLPTGKGSSSLDMEFTSKPMQPKEASGDFRTVVSHNKYESDDADRTLTDVASLSQTSQNVLPTSVLSIDKHLNWETLFMPYRRNGDTEETLPPMPVTVAKETRHHALSNLATLHEGFSETCIIRQNSERDVARQDSVDNTSVDNTSVWRLPDNETGITDEPDLTLVSGVTSTDISSLSPEKSIVTTPGRSTSGSSSLLSFEQHEHSLLDQATPQMSRKPLQSIQLIAVSGSPDRDEDDGKNTKASKDAKAIGVRFLLPTQDKLHPEKVDILPDKAHSLQDAFAARRPEFVHKSEQRLADAKEKAKKLSEKRIEELGQTIASWKKTRGLSVKPEKEAGYSATPTVLVVSAADRKHNEKEMKERTTRLYNRLEEVKQRKAMEERQQIYAQNREKRKEFEKKLSKHKKTGGAK